MDRKAGVRSLHCHKENLPNISQYRPHTCSITIIYVSCKKLTYWPSPHGVEVMQTKSTTVSVHRTLTERLPCISVRPFFLLLHVPPENKMIGSLKLSKLIIITTVLPVEPIIILDNITEKKNRTQKKNYEHQLYILYESWSQNKIQKSFKCLDSDINCSIMNEISNPISNFHFHFFLETLYIYRALMYHNLINLVISS